jgi:hypothetical protein
MDRVPWNEAREWREHMTERLKRKGIGVLDPTKNPWQDGQEEDETFRKRIYELKTEGRLEEAHELMKPVCSADLRMVDLCHFLICYIDVAGHMAGSYDELSTALTQKKPTLLIVKQGKERVPNWWLGVVPPEMIFSSISECINYISCVDEGQLDHKRWRFLDLERIYSHE